MIYDMIYDIYDICYAMLCYAIIWYNKALKESRRNFKTAIKDLGYPRGASPSQVSSAALGNWASPILGA